MVGDRAEKHLSVVILPNPAEFSLQREFRELSMFVFGKFGFSPSPVAVPILHLSGSQRLYNSDFVAFPQNL